MDPYVGQIQTFAFNYAPLGWAPCDGQLLQIQQNSSLFQAIGTTYGGNGTTDFALPNIAPLNPEGPSYYIALDGIFPTQ
jgi:microcystin-dependent protein